MLKGTGVLGTDLHARWASITLPGYGLLLVSKHCTISKHFKMH